MIEKVISVFRVIVTIFSIFVLTPIFIKYFNTFYKNFLTSSIVFNLDTLYLHWNTSFPAVTVCEIYNGEKLWELSERNFGSDRSSQLDDFIYEIVFYRGKCSSCHNCTDCPTDLVELLRIFRSDCDKLLQKCSWMGAVFDCCEKFLPLRTEYGLCFSFNSLQTSGELLPDYVNNLETGPGYLHFYSTEDIQIYVHPPLDLPTYFMDGIISETVLWGTRKEVIINIMDIYNEPGIEHIDPEIRNCRYPDEMGIEVDPRFFYFYSPSTCISQCTLMAQIDLCGCVPHFIFIGDNISDIGLKACDVQGLACIDEKYQIWFDQRINCECPISCDEPEYNIVYASPEESLGNSDLSEIKISLVELPTQRYVRKVSKNYLDLIISVGGMAGLFFGASLIRIIEYISKLFICQKNIYIFFRKFF